MRNLFITALLLVASSSAHANIVQNGSFEDTIRANGTWDVYNNINGWSTISGPGIEVRNNVAGMSSNGLNFVELDSHNADDTNSAMQQLIATSAGSLYELLFDHSPRVQQPSTTNDISVFWNGHLLADVTATGGNSNVWVTQRFFVTGTSSDELKFLATGSDDSFGGNIDYVRLNAVPVPAAAWLFGSALGLFGFARRNSV